MTVTLLDEVELDPWTINTPIWKDAPRAPTVIRSSRLVVVSCPYCGGEHQHNLDAEADPRRQLGGRVAHCSAEPWSRFYIEYRLVGIAEPFRIAEVRAAFPRTRGALDLGTGEWVDFDALTTIATERSPIPATTRALVWDKTGGRCWYCGAQTNPFRDFRVDHVHPVARGGTNDLANLAPACHPCNARKLARSVEEFRDDAEPFWFERKVLEG